MPKTWFGVLDAADAASEANEVAPAGTKTESVIPIKYDIYVLCFAYLLRLHEITDFFVCYRLLL